LTSDEERRAGFRTVILLYSAATAVAGILVWFLLPGSENTEKLKRPNPVKSMLGVMRWPVAWAQAAIIVCAYCAFKGMDNFALYAVQVLGMDELEAARFTAFASYLRPVSAVAAGLLADRFSAGKIIGIMFLALIISFAVLGFTAPSASWVSLIYVNVFVSFFAVFALRGVYFALLEESKIPRHLTGTTVGLVSFVGYTPDIFFAPIGGRILDYSPGLVGHQNYWAFLSMIALTGLLVALGLIWINRKNA